MLTAAPKTLCREIFLSAPYSTIVPKKPALWGRTWLLAVSLLPTSPLSPYTPSPIHTMHGTDPRCSWGNSRPGRPWRSLAVGALSPGHTADIPPSKRQSGHHT